MSPPPSQENFAKLKHFLRTRATRSIFERKGLDRASEACAPHTRRSRFQRLVPFGQGRKNNCFAAYRPWQTRTHCCGHIVADTNVSPFARARNICCGHKFCVRDTKNVSDFVQKYFVSATNVSQFAQPITGSCYKKMKTPVNECYLKDGFVIIYYNRYGRQLQKKGQ